MKIVLLCILSLFTFTTEKWISRLTYNKHKIIKYEYENGDFERNSEKFNQLLATINDSKITTFIIDYDMFNVNEDEIFYLFTALKKKNTLTSLEIVQYDQKLFFYIEELLNSKLDLSFKLIFTINEIDKSQLLSNSNNSDILIDDYNSIETIEEYICDLLKSKVIRDKTSKITIHLNINRNPNVFRDCIDKTFQIYQIYKIHNENFFKDSPTVVFIVPNYDEYSKIYSG